MILAQLKRDAIKQLARHYPDTAEIEADILIKHCLGLTSAELIHAYHNPIDEDKTRIFKTQEFEILL